MKHVGHYPDTLRAADYMEVHAADNAILFRGHATGQDTRVIMSREIARRMCEDVLALLAGEDLTEISRTTGRASDKNLGYPTDPAPPSGNERARDRRKPV